jgi:hypothetical protein
MELRFRQWMERDPDRASLAGRAMAAASFLPAMFRGPVATCSARRMPASMSTW